MPLANLESSFNIEEHRKKKPTCSKLKQKMSFKRKFSISDEQPGCSKIAVVPKISNNDEKLLDFEKAVAFGGKNLEIIEESRIQLKNNGKMLTLEQKVRRNKKNHSLRPICRNVCRRKCGELDEETKRISLLVDGLYKSPKVA
ncbi:uncharacterized protein LOC126744264 [Anthonomus grandis grandis]|uniref:uncharacterized protein LOC126744264 n=1 Tax=Anthonomus grandis grandis TaxID=2921223 RepID=UPI0021657D30|nr:uncharacterized protein LOC126744264 [Anthonomus grandis grandis]